MSEIKGKILIVDDDPFSAQMLLHHLSAEYDVAIASTGVEALKNLKNIKPDLILLDIVMPDMDGYELFQHILDDPEFCFIPVLFITSMNETDCEARGLEQGAHDYLTKPYNPAIVRLRVRNHIKFKRNSDLIKEQMALLAQKNLQLEQLANYDILTGLPNRALFTDRIERALTLARRMSTKLAVFFVDLDKFKQINDKLGHDVGDWLLKAASERMETCIRKSDTVARIGGDEFAVLLQDVKNIENALYVAEKIRQVTQEPFVTPSDKFLDISASIGIALFPDHGDNESDLLRHADEAMYLAKRSGRNRVVMYMPSREVLL